MPIVLVLPDLAAILILFGALLFIYLCVGIVRALLTTASGAVSWIPGVGGWLKSGIHDAENKIVGEMTKWANGLDASIGWSLHQLARLVEWIGREIEASPNLLYTLAAITLGPGFAAATNSSLKFLYQHIHAVEAGAASALHRLTLAEKRLAHSVAQGVYPRLRAVEHATTRTIPKDVAGLRAQTKAIEAQLANLWKAISKREAIIVDTAFVGAIAIALSRLGLGNLRCPQFGRMLGKWGCGLGGLLDDLLGVVVSALFLENVCSLLPVLETAFGDVVGPVTHLLTDVPLGGCETPPKAWAQLSVAAGPLPPRQTLGALPI